MPWQQILYTKTAAPAVPIPGTGGGGGPGWQSSSLTIQVRLLGLGQAGERKLGWLFRWILARRRAFNIPEEIVYLKKIQVCTCGQGILIYSVAWLYSIWFRYCMVPDSQSISLALALRTLSQMRKDLHQSPTGSPQNRQCTPETYRKLLSWALIAGLSIGSDPKGDLSPTPLSTEKKAKVNKC